MTERMKEMVLDGIEDRYLSEAMNYTIHGNGKFRNRLRVLGRVAAGLAVIIG